MTPRELKRLTRLLKEAPSTVRECAALMGLPSRRVQIGVWQLTRYRKARAVGMVSNSETGRGQRRSLTLYAS